MGETYRWVYKIVAEDDVFNIHEGEWITALPASKICQWFENIGYKIVYLNRICQVWAVCTNELPLGKINQKVEVMTYAGA